MEPITDQLTNGSTRTLVKPIRLTDQVSELIKQRIYNRSLRPGDRVVEIRLARELGVGQNAVREALIELSHLGYVRRLPNKGTYVTQLTQADAQKIAQVRAPLEALAITLLAERLLKEPLDLCQLEHLVGHMRDSAERADMVSFYGSDLEFHRTLWQLSGNEYLAQLLEQIVAPLFAFFIMINLNPAGRLDWSLEAVAHHERVLAALESRSPESARNAIEELESMSLRQQRDILSEEASKISAPTVPPEGKK
jgi:DNA-binding GntR family transcriptional regulator